MTSEKWSGICGLACEAYCTDGNIKGHGLTHADPIGAAATRIDGIQPEDQRVRDSHRLMYDITRGAGGTIRRGSAVHYNPRNIYNVLTGQK